MTNSDYIGPVLYREFHSVESRISATLENRNNIEVELRKCNSELHNLETFREQLKQELTKRGIAPFKVVD